MEKILIIKKDLLSKNIFIRARIILSLYYVSIMFIILMIFSGALVFIVESKIHENFNGKIVIIEDNNSVLKKATNDIEFFIYSIDSFLLLLIALASYFLAGKTLKPIKETLETQKKFLADASHDLRTPIAIITTDSEVTLQNTNSNATDFKKLAISNLEEVKKMSAIVNDLLILARGESHKSEITNIYLSNLLNNCTAKMESQAKIKNLKLTKNIEEDIFVYANKEDLERALNNILQNAINYTKAGSIKIKLQKVQNKIILEVADTGVGIVAEDLPFVFDRFFKAEHSRNDGAGSGLGLSIAQDIIRKSNGSIEIKSGLGIGTTVLITF